ncbi:MAG TPA: ferritin-like domain-containing protein [Solirubrobacteraceae bacterium]|jgi:CDGSH-type Zn-finger protein/truncated hemoglobin YjbI|nr:ferritin-like domain-containing protein [Solirubrobacteraceae bacterium]
MIEPEARAGQGRLAQVIAARGGQAAPEAPFVIEHREALIYMLCEAAELEHGIMCQYLFAAFSLKQREGEGVTAQELEAVTHWRRAISHVATEEMLHLALVHNLLSALGAAPHLGRPNLPAPAHHYPAGVNLTLVPFGEQALKHFMFLERPEGMALKGAKGIDAPVHDAVPLMAERDIVPHLQDFATVGHLYRSIEQGIAHLAEKFGERGLFVGPPRAQATSEHFRWPELVAVTDLASAQQAIDTILEQGEGARGHWEQAHFGQFVQILDEYRAMMASNPNFDPVRPVMFATVRPCEHDENVPLIGERVTSRCADLFNVSYEVLLQMLERYFAHTEETDAQLATLANTTIALMVRVLKPLGDLITTLPAGPSHPGLNAGPTFELFYETDYLMPHREAAWTLLEERLREAANFCGLVQEIASESVAEELEPVCSALGEAADSLSAHFADWGGVSRFAPSGTGASAHDREELSSLRSQASALAGTVGSVEPEDERVRQVGALLADTVEACLTAVSAAEEGASGADRDQAGEAAERLLNSVIRPLVGAASGRPRDARGADGGSEVVHDRGRPDADASASLPEMIWALAQSATTLRAQSGLEPRQGALIMEATAGLQDLALALSPSEGPDAAELRLARLRELQAGCEPGIQCEANGPYLLTNVASLRNWLGEEMPMRPQMAVCRCGESAIKPSCDGTCARTGFTDEKDPNRVADHRDTYDGVQLTVYDNRGICQHSGFCTDRLANVFHTEGAFVTPSGGRMDEIIRAVRDCPSGALSYAIDGVEARRQVDWDDSREPVIEVSRDGPYRITGAIPLSDADGAPVERAEGGSVEHYALCRCGHSQNKPFCSGMHWYVEFKDPVPDPERVPTLFEWCGGLPALTRMTRIFYEKHVPADGLLAPLFAGMSPDHPQRVAKWLGEVFGGPKLYSEGYGGYQRMISQHLGRELTEDMRARWVALICLSAQEAGLPSDPEFQAAFRSYIEWGSRLALENSQSGAKPPPQMPMPRWWWPCDAVPGSRVSALEGQDREAEDAIELPGEDEPLGFEQHIKQLFRERDRQSMKFAFDLWSYDDVSKHADAILQQLGDGTMPCDGAWAPERVAVFRRWVQAGRPASATAPPA